MPPAQWAQRKDVVFVSFLLNDVKNLDLKIAANKVHFRYVSVSVYYF
jgi:hypothetical protein